MSPAFGPVEAKALYPYFTRCADSVSCCPIRARSLMSKLNIARQIVDKWHEVISTKESEGAVIIDVHFWLSKATLDAYVGETRTFK